MHQYAIYSFNNALLFTQSKFIYIFSQQISIHRKLTFEWYALQMHKSVNLIEMHFQQKFPKIANSLPERGQYTLVKTPAPNFFHYVDALGN